MRSPSLLATRLLSKAEEESLKALGYNVDQTPSIEVELIDFEMPNKLSDVIFTSQNAIKSFAKHSKSKNLISKGIRAYCVGEKTASLAVELGFILELTANNSEELAGLISEQAADKNFVYFSGSISMRELVKGLKKDLISHTEVVVYQTIETQPSLEKTYDVILFFSPSGVRSIKAKNTISKSIKVCIGPTTAREFKNQNNILIAEYPPSFNHMIQALKQFKQ